MFVFNYETFDECLLICTGKGKYSKMLGFKRSMVQIVLFFAWALQNWTFGHVLLWYSLAFCLSVSVVLMLLTYDHDYWADRGVFSPPALPLVGHIKDVVSFKEQGGEFFKRMYDTYTNESYIGCHQFFQRTLVIRDPALIKRVCVTEFPLFMDRGFYFNETVDPLAGSVLYLRGEKWKKMRAKISPIFSPNKLRGMLPILENTADEFVIRIRRLLTKHKKKEHSVNHTNNNSYSTSGDTEENTKEDGSTVVDSEKLLGGYTADAIVPCAFGLKSNVMDNENDPFAVALHAFYEMSLYNIFEKTMRQFWPAFVLFFRMRMIPKRTHDFFTNIVTGVLRAREKGLQEKRGDFIDVMTMLRDDDSNRNVKVNDDIEITDMVISANAFIILLGGFETTSSTLAFLMLELAAHPHVQDKLRAELRDVTNKHGRHNYDMLQELTYMEMVIQETLRLYPPFPTIQRAAVHRASLPAAGGVPLTLDAGTVLLFPTLGLHRDPQYFEEASSFIPERWSEGNPPPPPGVYMPFGDGPRYCIGKRFAMIQMKCCLVKLLGAFRLSPAVGPRSAPFPADPRSPLTLHPADSRVKISLL